MVSALERGLRVLRAFGPDNRPIGNAEISERVGLPKPTVSRITFTLTELGYLRYDADVARYTLGPAVLTLGFDVLAGMEIRDVARPIMRRLAEGADASVFLGVPSGTEVIYVESCRSPVSMTIRLDVGSRLPMATTGIGRAYLAALPEEAREELIARIAPAYGADWPPVEAKLRTAIAEAKTRGFATTIGDWIAEANSAGAVIRRPDGTPAYLLNLGGLRSIITRKRLESDLGHRVAAAAREIEEAARGIL
jgi:DNA-binding IclR family transcriptional regulator